MTKYMGKRQKTRKNTHHTNTHHTNTQQKTWKKQQKQKKQKTYRKDRKKTKIVDPEFSKSTHKGTQASSHCELCERSYHYQSYSTFTDFIEIIHEKRKLSYVYMPADFSDMTIELTFKNRKINPLFIGLQKFKKEVMKGIKDPSISLIPVVFNLEIDKGDNHANCIVIHKQSKHIELFEPHGHRMSASTLGGNVGAYNQKLTLLRKFWRPILPDYRVINVVDEVKKTAFQMNKDPVKSTGYCVTWSLLYAHYRILNPTVDYKVLIRYIDHKIGTRLLLRYARKVEETLKFDDT